MRANAQVRKSVVTTVGYHLPSKHPYCCRQKAGVRRREEAAPMIDNTFGVGVAGAVLAAGTSHAAHTAAPAAAVKHRAAAATDASVEWGHT